MKFCYEHRGSISIFLLAVMFAMLVFSFCVLDLAKIELATAQAKSDTALAASSSLTYYDKALADAYGLLASSANTEELSKNVADYYVATMAASGIKIESDNQIYDAIRSIIMGADDDAENNNNMLNLLPRSISADGYTAPSGIVVSPVRASAVSNTAVMKRQIVEYMKYRAPVNLATGVLEKINVFKDLGNQTAAAQKKIEFENNLSKVQNSSDSAYMFIQNYNNNIEKVMEKGYVRDAVAEYNVKTSQTMTGIYGYNGDEFWLKNSSILWSIGADMGDMVERTEFISPFRSVMNSSGYLNPKKDIKAQPPSSVDDFKNVIDQYFGGNRFNFELLEKLYDKGNTNNKEKKDFKSYIDEDVCAFYAIIGREATCLFKENPGYRNVDPQSDRDSLGYFYHTFMKLYFGYQKCDKKVNGKSLDSGTEQRAEKIYKVLTWALGVPNIVDPDTGEYIKTESENRGITYTTVQNEWSGAGSSFERYKKMMNDYMTTFLYQRSIAEKMSGDKSPLKKLMDDIEKAKESSKEWETNINKVQTEATQASMHNNFELEAEMVREIEKENVQKLMDTFAEHKEKYELLAYELQQNHFFSVNDQNLFGFEKSDGMWKLTDYGVSYEDFLRKWNAHTLNYKVYSSDDVHYIDSYIKNILLPNDDRNVSKIFENGKLTLSEIEHSSYTWKTVNIPERWKDYPAQILGTASGYEANAKVIEVLEQISKKNIIPTDKEKETVKALKDEGKSKKQVEEEDKKKREQEREDRVKELQKIDDEKKDSMEDVIGVTTFAEYAKEQKLDAQQIVYDEANSVSYDSKVGEDSDKDTGNTDYKTDGVSGMLGSISSLISNIAEAARDDLYIAEYLTGNFSCITTAKKDGKDTTPEKTLAGLEMNSDNNVHYRCELEYIIYGGMGSKSESAYKGAAIGTISVIRFALNLIYSFTDAEINAFTNSTSTALTVITPYLQPIVKTVLHIVISAAETANDMIELTKGNSVPIYKSNATWVCKGSNIAGKIFGDVAKIAVNELENQAAKVINSKIDAGAGELSKLKGDLLKQQKESIISMLSEKIISPIDSFLSTMVVKGEQIEGELGNKIRAQYDSMIDGICTSLETSASEGAVKIAADKLSGYVRENSGSWYSFIVSTVNSKLREITGASENATSILASVRESFNKKAKDIYKKIEDTVNSLDGKIDEAIDSAVTETKAQVASGIEMAGDKALSAINSKISSNLTGTRNVEFSSGGAQPDGISGKLLSMTYKDYLYLFLMIGLITGPDDELERAGRLMQVNLRKTTNSEYDMNKACTMFNFYSGTKVKTSMIGRFANSKSPYFNNLTNGYYEIDVTSFAGY